MEESNKKRLIRGGKVITLFIGALLTGAVCSGIWNFVSSVGLSIAAIVLCAGNVYAIIKAAKNIKD